MNYSEKKLKKIDLNEIIKSQYEELVKDIKEKLYNIDKLNAVIIFGSYARGDYTHKSDLDIMVFLDLENENKQIEEKIRKTIIKINLSKEIIIHTIFQYKTIQKEDKSLMLTIAREGQVIFSKKAIIISQNILGLKSYVLLRFETNKLDQVKKNKLQRFLNGYVVKGKKYKGLIDNDEVTKAGKGAIIVPENMLKKIQLYSQKIGVNVIQKGKFYK